MSSKGPFFALDISKIFSRDEQYVLKSIFQSYKKASAETLFSSNEIKVLKHMAKNKHKQSIKNVADAVNISTVTAKQELLELEAKGLAESETQGRRILWNLKD